MLDSDIVEQLLHEYTTQVDYLFNFESRKRKLRCGFCTRRYKYKVVLNHHVTTVHMADLKKLTDRQRKELIYFYIIDKSDISYHEFQQQYLRSLFRRNSTLKVEHFWNSNKKQEICVILTSMDNRFIIEKKWQQRALKVFKIEEHQFDFINMNQFFLLWNMQKKVR